MKLTITAITIRATITKNIPTRTLPSRVPPDSGSNYREARHYYNDRCKRRVFRSTNACTRGSYTLGILTETIHRGATSGLEDDRCYGGRPDGTGAARRSLTGARPCGDRTRAGFRALRPVTEEPTGHG